MSSQSLICKYGSYLITRIAVKSYSRRSFPINPLENIIMKKVASRFYSPFFATFWMATRLTFSPAEKISARSPRDGPRSARLQSRTPAKDKPGRQSFRESPSAVRTAERLAKPAEPQTALPAAVLSEPTEAETSAQAGEANAMAAEVSRHEEEVLIAARKWPLGGGSSAARHPPTDPLGALLSTRSKGQPEPLRAPV